MVVKIAFKSLHVEKALFVKIPVPLIHKISSIVDIFLLVE
jgi:hypothetical protein